jgi:GNAT superfamily N-acetyltransferase
MENTPDIPVIHVSQGFAPDEAAQVAEMFWQAFRAKLIRIMSPDARAKAFLASVLNPDFALAARDEDGVLLGIAGFKTDRGGLVGGELRDLARIYGWFGALWRGPLLSLLEREVEADTLLMDGIFVTEAARGQGVGTALLNGIKAHAIAHNLISVRLDVIDTNPRAKALYLRHAFKPVGEENLGPLRHVFGFRSATRMIWTQASPGAPVTG